MNSPYSISSNVLKLSKRWKQEGIQFKKDLNGFLDSIYKGTIGPSEPQETRTDMVEEVYQLAVKLNAEGKHKELRNLFPPAFEPFIPFYDSISRSVNQICVLNNGDIIARADGNIYLDDGNIYVIKNDIITIDENDIIAFGISENKKFVAKVTKSKILVLNDWNGDVIHTFDYPHGYGEATLNIPLVNFVEEGLIVTHVEVFNDGERVLLVTTNGIFVLSNGQSQCVLPNQDMVPQYLFDFYEEYENDVPFEITLDYLHATLSSDDRKIAAGFQMSKHYILEETNGNFEITSKIQSRSEYPHAAAFNDTIDNIAFASCHYQQSAVFGVDQKELPLVASASMYDEVDERFDNMHDNMWVYSILPYKEGYLLGANNGYIWYINPKDPNDKAYLHVGGTIMSMDFSSDKTQLVVGTYSGYIIKFDLNALDRDPTLISDMTIEETNRWVIWNGTDPLIW